MTTSEQDDMTQAALNTLRQEMAASDHEALAQFLPRAEATALTLMPNRAHTGSIIGGWFGGSALAASAIMGVLLGYSGPETVLALLPDTLLASAASDQTAAGFTDSFADFLEEG